MSIEIRDLSYIYMPGTPFEKKALNGVNLKVENGEFVGLIGHTGSGKSTLAQHLNGLLKPSQGSVWINSRNLWLKKNPLEDICRLVGLVFQYPEYQLFGETVLEDVAFGPKNLGLEPEALPNLVKEALTWVGMDYAEFKDRSPFALSGGEKRKVAVAGVIAMGPETLVLDEPTAGLDPAGRKEMIRFVQRYQQKHQKTVIWITHNMDEIARIATRLVVMDEGRIAMDGAPRQIFSREEELKKLGLDIPAAAAVVRQLKNLGKPLPGAAITVQEAFAEISHWLGGKNSDR